MHQTIMPQTHTKTLIWLHGLGASGDDFISIATELKLTETLGIKHIFPNAPVRPITLNDGMPMPGWYDIYSLKERSRQDEAGILESVATIHQLIQAEINSGIKSEHIMLVGFSQGGAIALFSGLTYDQKLGGILALSTYMPIHNTFKSHKHSANQNTPILMMHGTDDDIIPLEFAKESQTFLANQHYLVESKTYPMAHTLCYEQLVDIKAFVSKSL